MFSTHCKATSQLLIHRRLFAVILLFLCLTISVRVGQGALRVAQPATQRTDSVLTPQEEKDIRTLEQGKPIERELTGGRAHNYQLTIAAGQYLRVVVEERGVDVVVTLYGPDGGKHIEVDSVHSPMVMGGTEQILLVAAASATYRLEVRSPNKDVEAGRYQLKIEEARNATGQDSNRVIAYEAVRAAEKLTAKGDMDSIRKAHEKYEEALKFFRAMDENKEEAMTLNSLALMYKQIGEKQKALDSYNQSLHLVRAAGDLKKQGLILNNMGEIYDDMGDREKALDLYNQALSYARSVGDHSDEGRALINIGFIYRATGERQKALDSYNQSLPLFRSAGDRYGESAALDNIGFLYYSIDEKQKALESFLQALSARRAAGDRKGEATLLHNIGFVYNALGDSKNALDSFNQASLLYRAMSDPIGEAGTFVNIGFVYSSMGDKQKTLDSYRQALSLFQGTANPKAEADALRKISLTYYLMGENQKALGSFMQALPILREIGDRPGEAETLSDIGKLSYKLSEKQKALDFSSQALSLFQIISDRQGQAEMLHQIALITRSVGELNTSFSKIEAALSIIEELRFKIGSQELRTTYFAFMQESYKFYIDLLMELHKKHPAQDYDAKALQASESARARSLLELLVEGGANIRQGVDPSLLERERTLQQQLNTKAERQTRLLGSALSKEQASAVAKEIAALEKEIESLTSEYQQLQAQIRVKSPRYAALTQPQPLSLKEIQEMLDPDTLLLEYALGEERSYLWAITPTGFNSFELTKRAEVEATARRVYELLTARNRRVQGETSEARRARVNQADAEYSKAAAALSEMILKPVGAQLGNKRLVIVSDGALQYISFAALPTPATESASRKRETNPPLISEHEIVTLPSSSTLAVLRRELQGRAPATKTVAVLADPVFSQDDERVKVNIARKESLKSPKSVPESNATRDVERAFQDLFDADSLRPLTRLYGTKWEAQQIKSLVSARKSMQALGFAANRRMATSDELSQYRILHFATHALINPVHPELSGIVLSLVDERGQPQDGFLRAHEIFNLKLPAELVVLSACQTGLGKQVKGEGLIGLTRGFMYAGTPRVVVSVWSVDDRATSDLMVRFYKKLLGAQKKSPAAALRAAQIEMLKDARWNSPYYWAGFILQGDWRQTGAN